MAAAQAGALVDFAAGTPSAVPEPDAAFDIVVFNRLVGSLPASDRADLCAEALRVLRPGGRLIAVERTRRPLLFGLASTAQTPGASGAQIVALAHHAGFRAARILSESQGLLFVEATKPSLAP
jgi:SAM-dependent methyltransferase